ncbi:hypothetical protein CC86DRAFT_204071 [Ophiobolus disseminans]|uniref:Uncharacterized protein n=1 Tax=Ophiobolus disseminans TaxID=1469910 RepID=A0A6A7A4L1_9PLEO|nr:hypothetical protein CC86DRAFT_204071 [Ophiobolus disseminans]
MQTSERHRHKRPFQPAITSYFARYDDLDSDNDDDPRGLSPRTRPQPQLLAPRLAPTVPGPVQADLLQVGMRVRKSVPEGYKTHSAKMSNLPSIQTTLSKPPTSTITAVGLDVKAARDPVPDAFVHQRELLPFCGLHKIGGFAEQPTTNIHLYAGVDASTGRRPANMFPLPAEAFSTPFSSQDSGYGSDFLRANPSKRSWRDDDDARLDLSGTHFFFAGPGMRGGGAVDDVPVSPLSETPEILPRVVKTPKSRMRPSATRGISGASSVEDVEMEFEDGVLTPRGRIGAGSASDFEEADFLGGEVDMGGV